VGQLLGCLLLLVPSGAGDLAEPIATDRPDFTETARVVPRGRIQWESGIGFTRAGSAAETALGEALLRIATGHRTEARVGVNSWLRTSDSGRRAAGKDDFSLGFKVELADASPRFSLLKPDVALIAQTSIPSGSSAYRERNPQPEAKLCLAWDLDSATSLGSNLNYAWASESGDRFGRWSASASLSRAIGRRLSGFIELFAFLPAGRNGPNATYAQGGIALLPHPDLQLDFHAGVGFNSASPDYFLGVGVSRRW